MRKLRLTPAGVLAAVTGLLALLVAAIVTVAHATPTSASGCVRADAVAALFPRARTVGFIARSPIERVGRRHPYWPGWCGNWTATYKGERSTSAELKVSTYKTQRNALVALGEPAFGPTRILSNGVRVRSAASASIGPAVASVVRNVFISSNGTASISAQMRIHRRIHSAVLQVR